MAQEKKTIDGEEIEEIIESEAASTEGELSESDLEEVAGGWSGNDPGGGG